MAGLRIPYRDRARSAVKLSRLVTSTKKLPGARKVSHLIMYCYYSVAMGIGRGERSDMASYSLVLLLYDTG
nr:hypothetical protein Q903MT_gene2096 [Picea sitchensis]